jgi:hypothetical protein
MKTKYKITPKKQYVRKPRGLSGSEFNKECKKYGLISYHSTTRPFELIDIYYATDDEVKPTFSIEIFIRYNKKRSFCTKKYFRYMVKRAKRGK